MKAVKGYKSLYIANNGIYKIRIAVLPLVQKFYYTPKKLTILCEQKILIKQKMNTID